MLRFEAGRCTRSGVIVVVALTACRIDISPDEETTPTLVATPTATATPPLAETSPEVVDVTPTPTPIPPIGETSPEVVDVTPTPAPTPTLLQISVERDREALIALYNATDGPTWRYWFNWLSDAPIDKWHGVITDDNGPRHQSGTLCQRIEWGGITGVGRPCQPDNAEPLRKPTERGDIVRVGNLVNLAVLDLGINQLSGEIPPALGNLVNLTTLSLIGNELSGKIPVELGNLATLAVLDLGINQLSGEIPPALGNLVNLTNIVPHR